MTDDDRRAFVRTVGPRTVRLRSQLCLLALILVVMALASLQAQRPRGSGPADGLIVGRVLDAAGQPVAGAVVALVRSVNQNQRPSPATRISGGTAPDRVLTGADGYFVFRDLPLGNFTLTAAKAGYVEGAFGRRRPGGPVSGASSYRCRVAARDHLADVEIRCDHRRGHR